MAISLRKTLSPDDVEKGSLLTSLHSFGWTVECCICGVETRTAGQSSPGCRLFSGRRDHQQCGRGLAWDWGDGKWGRLLVQSPYLGYPGRRPRPYALEGPRARIGSKRCCMAYLGHSLGELGHRKVEQPICEAHVQQPSSKVGMRQGG